LGFNYKLNPDGIVFYPMEKSGVFNEEMKRKTHGSSSQYEVLVTKNRGELKKRNRRVVEKRVRGSPSQDTRI